MKLDIHAWVAYGLEPFSVMYQNRLRITALYLHKLPYHNSTPLCVSGGQILVLSMLRMMPMVADRHRQKKPRRAI